MTVINLGSKQVQKMQASIEVAPKQAITSDELPNLFPKGTRVYITDIGIDTTDDLVKAAKRVQDLGYHAVPHFASRRLSSKANLHDRIKRTAQEAGVEDVLVIGGGLPKQAGDFSSTMEVLETGYFDACGIKKIAIAGHPEGSPDFSDEVALAALRLKQDFANRSDAELRIVTQFGFDADKFIRWADHLQNEGITLPIHLGVAGPAKITTLIKFAAMCGVGNSMSFLKKHALSVTALATSHSPETVVKPIESRILASPDSNIRQIHVFPFGGLKNSAQWLADRKTWDIKTSLYPSANNA